MFSHLFEAAEIARFDRKERYEYEESLKAYRDWFSVMETAETRGFTKGLEKGKEEGVSGEKKATARRMKDMGLPVDVIAIATGLTNDEIAQL